MPEDLTPINVPLLDQYRMVRQQIEHEDSLVNQRLSWLLGSQSFLFTAYAISVNGPPQIRSKALESTVGLLILLLPLMSIISALLIGLTIWAGMWTMQKLRRTYRRRFTEMFAQELPPIQSTGGALFLGHFAPIFLPALFIVIWMLLILRK